MALRGLFIIAPDGTLRQKTVNDLPVGRSVDETLRLLKAFQFTDEHGEVRCRVGAAGGGGGVGGGNCRSAVGWVRAWRGESCIWPGGGCE